MKTEGAEGFLRLFASKTDTSSCKNHLFPGAVFRYNQISMEPEAPRGFTGPPRQLQAENNRKNPFVKKLLRSYSID